jgi:hypothetical protein
MLFIFFVKFNLCSTAWQQQKWISMALYFNRALLPTGLFQKVVTRPRKWNHGVLLEALQAQKFGGHGLYLYMSQDRSTIVLVITCFNLTRGVFCYIAICISTWLK